METLHPDTKQLLVCGICEGRLIKPKCLPCMHSFCTDCIHKFILKNVSDSEQYSSAFNCPSCLYHVEIPVKNVPVDGWSSLLPPSKLVVVLIENHAFQEAKFCDPCRRGNEEITAKSWCLTCSEALCEKCTIYHKRVKVLMEHEVIPIKDAYNKLHRVVEVEEYCQVHAGKKVEAICYDHDALCCLECVTYDHKKCRQVESLEEAVVGIRDGNSLKVVTNRLKWLQEKSRSVINSRSQNILELEAKRDDILSEVANLREDICGHLDKMEQNLKDEFSKMHQALSEKLEIQSKNFECLHKTSTNGLLVLNASNVIGSDSQLFVAVYKLRKVVEEYEEHVKTESKNIYHHEYEVKINDVINKFRESVLSIGQLGIKKSPTNLLPAHTRDMRVVEVADIVGKSSTDDDHCWFTGGKFLQNGKMVFSDYRNKKLKCFDTSYKLVSQLCLHGKPWDFCFLKEGEMIVTIPDDPIMEMVTIDDEGKMTIEKESIQVQIGCYGIHIRNNKLYVACSNEIRIMELNGVLTKTIPLEDRGTRYIQLTNDTRMIYTNMTSVVYHDIDGKTKLKYKDLDLRSPRGFTRDQEGNIYVCGMDSNNVHLLTPSGSRYKLLLTARDGIRAPYYIGFESGSTNFFLSQMDCDDIKVYKLITKW